MNNTNNMNNKNTFKVVLVGDGGVGKTTYINRFKTGEFEKKYVPTVGVEVKPLVFHTNQGKFTLNIWDTAGVEKYGGLRDGYYIGADACIFMFDITSRSSFVNIFEWVKQVRRVNQNLPSLLVGNKSDLSDRKVRYEELFKVKEYLHMLYYDVSALSNYNFEKPFLALLRVLSGNPSLQFVESPSISTPVVSSSLLKLLSNYNSDESGDEADEETDEETYNDLPDLVSDDEDSVSDDENEISDETEDKKYMGKVVEVMETHSTIKRFLYHFDQDQDDEKLVLAYLSLKHIH